MRWDQRWKRGEEERKRRKGKIEAPQPLAQREGARERQRMGKERERESERKNGERRERERVIERNAVREEKKVICSDHGAKLFSIARAVHRARVRAGLELGAARERGCGAGPGISNSSIGCRMQDAARDVHTADRQPETLRQQPWLHHHPLSPSPSPPMLLRPFAVLASLLRIHSAFSHSLSLCLCLLSSSVVKNGI